MSAVENLNVGDYIVVIGDIYRNFESRKTFDVNYIEAVEEVIPIPLKVLAISAPFALCEYPNGEPISVDQRYEFWTKVNDQFVREYCRMLKAPIPPEMQTEDDQVSAQRKCPLCAEIMSERRGSSERWDLYCSECEMTYVPIKK